VFIKETVSSWLNLAHINTPSLAQIVKSSGFSIHDIHSTVARTVVQTDDTIGDTLGLDKFDPSNLRCVISMGSTARLGVDTCNVDNTELVTGHNTTLVKTETVVSLCISLVHHALVDINAFANKTISLILDGTFLFTSQRFVVRNIQMSLLSSLLCTCLPNVRSKHLAATSKNNMSASMVSQELNTTLKVNLTLNSLAYQVELIGNFSVNLMEDTFANLDRIDNFHGSKTFNRQHTSIVLLTT